MSEATVLKPTPGRRAAPLQVVADNSGGAEQTVVAVPAAAAQALVRLPAVADNPLIDEAATLLSLVTQIRHTSHAVDVGQLRSRCLELMRQYESALRQRQVGNDQLEAARYCLCSFVDETVLNTNWGGQSEWSRCSLLSSLHRETLGGAYFFSLLEQALAEPHRHQPLLELQYLCLSLGFMGKMRMESNGHERLIQYRQRTYEAIRRLRGEPERELSPSWRTRLQPVPPRRGSLPAWVVVVVGAVVLLGGYMGLSRDLNVRADAVFRQVNALVPAAPTLAAAPEPVVADSSVADRLRQLLATEISLGLLEIEPLPDRVRLRIGAHSLFASASAEVREDYLPVLTKIGRALVGEQGRLLITGHTDDQPIFTSRYPSNWHLSLARANAVADLLAANSGLNGRLWPEGRGDSEPRVDNSDSAQRALNRRVEIDLLM